jgi:hypothetical protein
MHFAAVGWRKGRELQRIFVSECDKMRLYFAASHPFCSNLAHALTSHQCAQRERVRWPAWVWLTAES